MQDRIVHVVCKGNFLQQFLLRGACFRGVGQIVEGAEIEHHRVSEVSAGLFHNEQLEPLNSSADLLNVQAADGQVVHRSGQVRTLRAEGAQLQPVHGQCRCDGFVYGALVELCSGADVHGGEQS